MKQDLIKKILLEFEEGELPEVFERDLKLPKEVLGGRIRKAVIITGPRRAGKTYYLYHLASILKGKNILYFNFEDERVVQPTSEDLTLILESYFELHPETNLDSLYVFLDEVENIDNWEKFVRRILEKGARVFITGSNSKLLAGEISTALRGRSISFKIHPFSFKEFLKVKGIKDLKNIVHGKGRFLALKILKEYLKWGGFPEIAFVKEERLKRAILQEYLLTMVHRDVEERYKIDNLIALENLIKFMITNISTPLSFNGIEKWMNSIGIRVSRATLIDYSRYLENAFAFSLINKFDYSVKRQTRSQPKAYASDVGLYTANSFKFSRDKGKIAENVVYNHLLTYEKEIYYDSNGYECDFILKKGEKVVDAIQVCWKIDETNKEREVRGLLASMKKFNLKKGKIVNLDHKNVEKIDGLTVEYIPLLEFLLK